MRRFNAAGCSGAAALAPRRHQHAAVRSLITGTASREGLDQFVARKGAAALVPRREMPRTGWSLPAITFGGDDVGAPIGDRMGLMHLAVLRRGVNAILLDGDAIYARRSPKSMLYATRGFDRDWEYHALNRLLAPGRVDRSELLLMARLSIGKNRFEPDSAVSVSDVSSRVAALLVALDLQCLDLLHVFVPSSRSEFPPDQMRALVAELEGLVASGHIQYYGIGCETFTAVAGGASGAAPGLRGQPLKELVAAAEGARGLAAKRRAELQAAAAAAGAPLLLGNRTSRPDVASADGSGQVVQVWKQGQPTIANNNSNNNSNNSGSSSSSDSSKARPHPDPDGHHLVSLTYDLSPVKPDVILPSVVDGRSGSSFSASELARRYGWTQFVRAPLDATLQLPEGGTIFAGGGGSNGGGDSNADAAAVSSSSLPLKPRPFRFVSPPPHWDSHPSRSTPALNDVLNYAVHLEMMWDKAGVRAEVEAARAAEAAKAAAAASESAAPSESAVPTAAGVSSGKTSAAGGSKLERQLASRELFVSDAAVDSASSSATTAAGAAAGDSSKGKACSSSAAGYFPPGPTSPDSPAVKAFVAQLFPPTASDVSAASSPSSPSAAPSSLTLKKEDVAWARIIAEHFAKLDNYVEWQGTKGRRILPALARLQAATKGVEAAREWTTAYQQLMGALIGKIDVLMEQAQYHRAKAAAVALDAALPFVASIPSLTGKVLTAALSCPVDSVLTEVPEAFSARRKPLEEIRRAASAKDDAAAASRAREAEADAAAEGRMAARAAEIDALIAQVVTDAQAAAGNDSFARQLRSGGGSIGMRSGTGSSGAAAKGGLRMVESSPKATAIPAESSTLASTSASFSTPPLPSSPGSDASAAASSIEDEQSPASTSTAVKGSTPCAVDPQLFAAPGGHAIPFGEVQAAFSNPHLAAALGTAASVGLPAWEDPIAGQPIDSELAPLQEAVRRAQAAVRKLEK